MNRHLGDSSFSQLLRTPFAELDKGNDAPAKNNVEADFCGIEIAFEVYDLQARELQSINAVVIDARIDEESLTMFNTFDELLHRIYAPDISTQLVCKSDYDFAPLVSLLARILEVELNSSIVQAIRKEKGIEMPRYYKMYKPNAKCEVHTWKGDVDLNRKGEGEDKRHRAIILGDSLALMGAKKELLQKELSIDEGRIKSLIKQTDDLCDYRNRASHGNVINETEFIEFYNKFCALIEQGFLTLLADEKERILQKRC